MSGLSLQIAVVVGLDSDSLLMFEMTVRTVSAWGQAGSIEA